MKKTHSQRLSHPDSKLGLALSGGGFRAAFFHLGVLRRLAELNILPFVKVISTVSGGSIVGAHYYLILLEKLATAKKLTTMDYIEIIDCLETEFRGAVRKNIRNRLFLNPFANLAILCGFSSIGARVARLYNKHF